MAVAQLLNVATNPLPVMMASPATQVRALSPAFELVITAGGLGPTPDDVTMAGIAASLGTTLKRDATLEVLLAPPYQLQLPIPALLRKLAVLVQGLMSLT